MSPEVVATENERLRPRVERTLPAVVSRLARATQQLPMIYRARRTAMKIPTWNNTVLVHDDASVAAESGNLAEEQRTVTPVA